MILRFIHKNIELERKRFFRIAANADSAPQQAGKVIGYKYQQQMKKDIAKGNVLMPYASRLSKVMTRYKKTHDLGGAGSKTPFARLSTAISYRVTHRGLVEIGVLDKGPHAASGSWRMIARKMVDGLGVSVPPLVVGGTGFQKRAWFIKYGIPDAIIKKSTTRTRPPKRPFIDHFLNMHYYAMISDYRRAYVAKLLGERISI